MTDDARPSEDRPAPLTAKEEAELRAWGGHGEPPVMARMWATLDAIRDARPSGDRLHPHDGYSYDDCECVCCVNIRALNSAALAASRPAPGRWAFLDAETGEWIEVKDGTVYVESAASRPAPDTRTEALDAERLYQAMVSLDGDDPGVFNIVGISEPDTRPVAKALVDRYAALSPSKGSDPA